MAIMTDPNATFDWSNPEHKDWLKRQGRAVFLSFLLGAPGVLGFFFLPAPYNVASLLFMMVGLLSSSLTYINTNPKAPFKLWVVGPMLFLATLSALVLLIGVN